MTYERPKKYEQFEFAEEGDDESEPATSVRLRRSLSGDEITDLLSVIPDADALRTLSLHEYTQRLYPALARHIDGWNVQGIDPRTGKKVAVPTPTSDDPAALGILPDFIVRTLFARLQRDPRRRVEEQGKNSETPPTGPASSGTGN